jgi:hypothetical protein
MDEIDHSEWDEFHLESVYVLVDLTVDQVPIPVDRAGQRIALVGCICVDGSFMKQVVVIPRHRIDNDLPLLDIPYFSYRFCDQLSGFTNRELLLNGLKSL